MSHTEPTRIKTLKSPKGHMLLGHLPQFNVPNKHQVLERWVDECGDLFKINFVGKVFVASARPSFNNVLLRQRPEVFRRFSKIDEILKEMGVIGVFNAEGDDWKRHRKPIAEALNVQNIKRFYPVLLSKTRTIFKKFQGYSENQSVVDVQKEFMAFTIDITTEIAFGHKSDTISNKGDRFQKHLEIIFPMINSRITAPIPIWRFIKSKKDKALETSLKSIESMIYQFIDDAKVRIESNKSLYDAPSNFLEALLVGNKNKHFTDKEVYGNVFTMLLAGEDTTSNSISWAMFYLSQHPEIVAKIREEAYECYPNKGVPDTYDVLVQLKYTNAVVQETIRLKPTTPQLYFEANRDTVIEDLEIPKGTKIILQNKVAQTNDNYFSAPDSFSPERWLKECPMHKNHEPSVIKTFGGGPRYCPGMQLAITEMMILISTLCKHFDFELAVNPEDIVEQFEFTMFPKNLMIKFKAIKNSL